MEKNVKVCVTGGAGYLASFLVKQLLERGYMVHATLRSLGDASKVGLLKGLAHADTRLKLFEADIYNPSEFVSAIEGCEFVVHMATPLQHYANNSQYKNTSEAAVAGVKIIMETCMKSNTVKRMIYTASVVAASPLKDDGSGYKDFMDETCWTPLNLSYEVLSSMACLISQATNDGLRYKILRFLEELLGKVPIVHIQDITEAHLFSMENSHINGRFLCASAFLRSAEIASLIQERRQNISIPQEFIEDTKRETRWGSRKLEDLGFQYKCDAEKTIDDSLLCAKRLGDII